MVLLGAVLHNPPGSIGKRQPANAAMRSHMVVVVAPKPPHRASLAEHHEQRFVKALVTQAAVTPLDVTIEVRALNGAAWARPSKLRMNEITPVSRSRSDAFSDNLRGSRPARQLPTAYFAAIAGEKSWFIIPTNLVTRLIPALLI